MSPLWGKTGIIVFCANYWTLWNWIVIIPSFLGFTTFSAMIIFFVTLGWIIYFINLLTIFINRYNKYLLTKYYIHGIIVNVIEDVQLNKTWWLFLWSSKFSWERFLDTTFLACLIWKMLSLYVSSTIPWLLRDMCRT